MTDGQAMKIKGLAPWFGSKRNLASRIVVEIGFHSSYFEPFCGSMAVLLQKPVSSHEDVNDLHADLINLALVIQDPKLGAKLYRRLRRTWTHEEVFAISRDALAGEASWEPPDVERAFHFFVFSWMGRNGITGTYRLHIGFARRWTSGGGHGGRRFRSVVDSIPAWRRRMRNVTIQRIDGFEMIAKIHDADRTAIYVDPPYLQKGELYVHDFEPADHDRLAELLARFRQARVVVSYYNHPRLADLYPGWIKVDCATTKSLANQGLRDVKGQTTKAPEVLLINGPSYTIAEKPTAPLFGGEGAR